MMRNILICACARRIRHTILNKDSNKKLIKTFFAFKKHWCTQNILKQAAVTSNKKTKAVYLGQLKLKFKQKVSLQKMTLSLKKNWLRKAVE
jgi:hypothetical protein